MNPIEAGQFAACVGSRVLSRMLDRVHPQEVSPGPRSCSGANPRYLVGAPSRRNRAGLEAESKPKPCAGSCRCSATWSLQASLALQYLCFYDVLEWTPQSPRRSGNNFYRRVWVSPVSRHCQRRHRLHSVGATIVGVPCPRAAANPPRISLPPVRRFRCRPHPSRQPSLCHSVPLAGSTLGQSKRSYPSPSPPQGALG